MIDTYHIWIYTYIFGYRISPDRTLSTTINLKLLMYLSPHTSGFVLL